MDFTVNCSLRKESGTTHSRNLRSSGFVPAVVYGKGKDPVAIYINKKELKMQAKDIFCNKVITLSAQGFNCNAIAKSYDLHPLTSDFVHIDFVFAENHICRFDVPLVFSNQAACQAIKFGAVLNIVRRSVSVKCKAADLPSCLEFDIQNCVVGQSIKLNQISLPQGVEYAVKDKNCVIATIIGKKSKAADSDEEEAKTDSK